MATITLKGREIPLLYTVYEMKEIQEQVCRLGDLQYVIMGRNRDDEEDSTYGTPEHLGAITILIRIMGNAGLEEAGETADLTDKKIMRALRPSEIVTAVRACLDAMNEGMASEIPPEPKPGPVDVVLEEIEEKKEQGS